MTIEDFKWWLSKKFIWNWEMNIDSNGILNVTLHFNDDFPSLGSAPWRARAYFIAPNFRQTANMRGMEEGRNKGGYFSANTPEWYPLPSGGWQILKPLGYYPNFEVPRESKFASFDQGNYLKSITWRPITDLKFSEVIKGYTYRYCDKVMKAIYFYETPTGESSVEPEGKLTKRGEIRQNALDIYLSVAIVFVVNENGADRCIYRAFGVPRHFVSKDLM